MTIDRIGSGPITPIGGSRDGELPVTQAVQGLARSAVAGVADALGLGGGAIGAARAYPIRESAAAISEQVGATPAQAGEIERAVERLAGAVAADMAARADGRTLDRVDQALAGGDLPAHADDVVAFLERVAERIETAAS